MFSVFIVLLSFSESLARMVEIHPLPINDNTKYLENIKQGFFLKKFL